MFSRHLILTLGLIVSIAATGWAVPPQATADPEAAADAITAMKNFKLPEGFKVDLFAAEPLLMNPVAFSIDEQGNIYIAETNRFSRGVSDNRQSEFWVDDDLAAQTVEDRLAYYQKWASKRPMNWYTDHEDTVRVVLDNDADGKADGSKLFAGGFNDALAGIGSGVLAYNGNIYYTNIPDLWHLQDTDGDHVADERNSLHHGYGVRTAFLGHDSHGLILGPDGKIYFTIGDRGYNIPLPDGSRLHDPMNVGRGAAFRCNPDGSDLEVVYWGLRNPQELAFDEFGNLFTGDNNSDAGDKARLVYLVEGGDAGWNMTFQYMTGDYSRGPWHAEKIWHLRNGAQPAAYLPPVAHVTSGPSGFTYYPGAGLPERYDNHFFLVDFRGGPNASGVWSFSLKPDGAGFEIDDVHQFIWNVLLTDVDFGYDGRIYGTDWINGWSGQGKGRIYAFSHPEAIKNPAVASTKRIFAEGFDKLTPDELAGLLRHADMRVRLRAHIALAEKNAVDLLAAAAKQTDRRLARLHGIWGLGIIGRRDAAALEPVVGLLEDSDLEVRANAAKVLGDAAHQPAAPALVKLLSDAEPRVQMHAAIALGDIGHAEAVPGLVTLLRTNNDADLYVRHGAVMGLVGCADAATLLKHAGDKSAAVRRGIVLALRRHQSPGVARFLNDDDVTIVAEAARAIYDMNIESVMPKLAAVIERYTKVTDGSESQSDGASFTAEIYRDKAKEPTETEQLSQLLLTGKGDSYRSRIFGHIVPDQTGEYRFEISADDTATLSLSTDDKPENLRKIAEVPGWNKFGDFDKHPAQHAKAVQLEGGRRYYIEVEHRQGAGPEHVAVAWISPDGKRRIVGSDEVVKEGIKPGNPHVVALLRRVIAANHRLGTAEAAERLAAFAATAENLQSMRLEAVASLGEFTTPLLRERVLNFHHPLPPRDRGLVAAALEKHIQALSDSAGGKLLANITRLAGSFGIAADDNLLIAWIGDPEQPLDTRLEALRSLSNRKHDRLDEAINKALASDNPLLRAEARDVVLAINPDRGLKLLDEALANGALPEQQRAYAALATLKSGDARQRIAAAMDQLMAGKLAPGLQLDVLEAAKQQPSLSAKVSAYQASLSAADPLAAYRVALQGGDLERGRSVFEGHVAAQCMRCHTIDGVGGNAGPDLSKVGQRLSREKLLESLVNPNAEIASGFGTVVLTLKNQQTIAGTLRKEEGGKVHLVMPDGKEQTIDAADIANRTPAISAMPPMGVILTPADLRDLIAYLAERK